MIKLIVVQILRILVSMRYSIRVEGLKDVIKKIKQSPKGTLFLPNHPSEMDPVLISLALGAKWHARPLIVEDFYFSSFIKLMKSIDAIPIPNFDSGHNSFKEERLRHTMKVLKKAMDKKDRVLLYPSGRLKKRGKEELGGKSLLSDVIKGMDRPNIVLVRTEGMWGSSFSTAKEGKTPDFAEEAKKGVIAALLNGIFFMPRRKISIRFELDEAFPYDASKVEMNQYLEAWYNQYHTYGDAVLNEEPLRLVPYYFWSRTLPNISERERPKADINLKDVPLDLYQDVLSQVSLLSKKPVEKIEVNDHLAQDLALDSLDKAELVSYLMKEYSVLNVRPEHLKTVGHILGYASFQMEIKREWVKAPIPKEMKWKEERQRPPLIPPRASSLQEAFLETCTRLENYFCCGDAITGPLTYKEFLLRATLLALKLKDKVASKHVGVLLPSTTACYLVIMALELLGKVPVMLNWTVGPRNLASMKESGRVDFVISSYAFLTQLQNVDLSPIEDELYLLEELKAEVTLKDKLKAYLLSRKPKSLLKTLQVHPTKPSDPAVLLFTSGTESFPKGVPLTHRNILSNLSQALESIELKPDDILYGILPPFHSFGFSITGMLPLIGGIKVAFSPNPTHAARIANGIKKWGITFMCLAPTFLKGILRASKPQQLDSLRLVVTGAEKLPDDVKAQFNELIGDHAGLYEGYGTTECSPVLSVNPPGAPTQGVGLPLKGIEIAIVDPQSHEKLALKEKGLVLASGLNIFPGYLKGTPKDTFIVMDGKRWYNTGDLGYLDERGYLTLVGRLKRFIKLGGEMISLPAIEQAILEKALKEKWPLHPDRPSFVVIPKEIEGEKPRLTLFTTLSLNKQDLNKYLTEAGFSNLVKIHDLVEIKEIPILGTGKVSFQELKSML